jgi:transposase
MRIAQSVLLTEGQRAQLQTWARGRRTPVRLTERSRIILLAGEGRGDKEIAAQEGCDRRTVARWRKRFIQHGLNGIERDAPRAEKKRRLPADKVKHIVHKTTQEPPPNGKRWSTRSMARAVGVSEATVRRIWRAEGIVPSPISAP